MYGLAVEHTLQDLLFGTVNGAELSLSVRIAYQVQQSEWGALGTLGIVLRHTLHSTKGMVLGCIVTLLPTSHDCVWNYLSR